jgi:hypothetical protein
MLVGGALSAAPLALEMDDRGVLRFGGELAGVQMDVGVHGPNWSYASAAAGSVRSERHEGTVTGELALPSNCKGALAYSVSATSTATGVEITCTERFTEETDIQGAYVSFYLPCASFEGRPARLPYNATAKALPRGTAEADLSGVATGFAVELDGLRSLVIAAADSGLVLVRPGRPTNGDRYEVRFHLWQQGHVVPGLTATRGFRVSIVPTREVDAVIQAVNPPLQFDAGKPYALLRPEGQLTVLHGRTSNLSAELAIHGLGWSYASQSSARTQGSGGDRNQVIQGGLEAPGNNGAEMRFVEQVTSQADGTLGLPYRLHFPQAVELNGYQLSFRARLGTYVGSPVALQTVGGQKDFDLCNKRVRLKR